MNFTKLNPYAAATLIFLASGCSHATKHNDIINVNLGADIATLDPQLTEDVQSTRIANDLFEGLISQDQNNKPIPGLAEKWQISGDGKTYTFQLRPGLKFSDGSPINASDVVFSFQRLADPQLASPYNYLIANIRGGAAIITAKAPPSSLAVTALSANTLQINLNHPDPSFLAICAQADLATVSQANVTKFGALWTQPKNMVSSGAYKLDERVVQGYILLSKNPYYYAANDVAIKQVKFFPIVDVNSSLSQYKSGSLDITYLLPVDQYKTILTQFPDQQHTVSWETIEYYSLNMHSPKFKNNPQLRQALSMAVDRPTLTHNILGQGQKPLYAYATNTVEGGKFSGIEYTWSHWPRAQQIARAQQLFKAAGYGPNHPLQLSISYNTKDSNKKNSLAIAAMWQQVFGTNSIHVISANQEWKTFIHDRHSGNFEIARDGWVADYDSVDSYSALFQCGNPQNNSKACTPGYNQLLAQAQNTTESQQRITLLRQALQQAMADYAIIPLYQDSYYRLVSPRISGYNIESNHLDHVMSKWYRYNTKLTALNSK